MNQFSRSIDCLGYPIFTGDLNISIKNDKLIINTINQYSYCMAEKDEAFKKSLLDSDLLLPDGIGIVAATKIIVGHKIKKISGTDLHKHLLYKLNEESGKCFYLGSSEKTLNGIKEKLKLEYPNIKVETYSPPFKSYFTENDNSQMLECINSFQPDVLFVGMTAPKQEKWTSKYKEHINAHVICSIGAVFDFYAGTVQRPNEIWINSGFEWLGRLLKEPKRMWKRYLYYGAVFGYCLIREKSKSLFIKMPGEIRTVSDREIV